MVYEIKTKKKCEEVIKQADNYFSEELGLEKENIEGCANYIGGGGFVRITCCSEENKRVVEIETREWDRMVKKFFKMIK